MAREWPAGVDVSELGGLAVVRSERAGLSQQPNLLTVVGSGSHLYWFIFNRQGRLFTWQDCPLPFSFTASEGDWLVLMRSLTVPKDGLVMALKARLEESRALDDLEERVLEILPPGTSALVASQLGSKNRLDQLLQSSVHPSTAISHVTHLDTRRGCLVEDVQPGRFGSTTRHCVIYRPPFLAALHHDASKINRFSPTIDYILKKILRARAEHGNSTILTLNLKRISEIQYFAYVVSHRGFLYCSVGGGASILLVRGRERRVIDESGSIHQIQLDTTTSTSTTTIFLLSPHFFALRHTPQPKEFFAQYCRERGIDLRHPKLSFAQFQLE